MVSSEPPYFFIPLVVLHVLKLSIQQALTKYGLVGSSLFPYHVLSCGLKIALVLGDVLDFIHKTV